MKKNCKRLLFFIVTFICLLSPSIASAEDRVERQFPSLPVTCRWQGSIDTSFPYTDFNYLVYVGSMLWSNCGGGNVWTGNDSWWYPTPCTTLQDAIFENGMTYYLYRNGVRCVGGMKLQHGAQMTNPPGTSATLLVREYPDGSTAWSTLANPVAGTIQTGGSQYITYEYRADPVDVTIHYAPRINNRTPSPASSTSNTRSSISGIMETVEKRVGDSVPLLPDYIVTGAVTNMTLTYISGDDTTLDGHYTVPQRNITSGGGLIQDDIFTSVGIVQISWGVRDYQGDQTNFVVRYNVTNSNYNYKVTADAGGTATPTAEGTALQGDEIVINATPSAGYEFDKWVVVDSKAPASYSSAVTVADNKFTMPASDVHIKATFKKIDYTVLAYGEVGKGTGTADKSTANMGDVVTLTATPEPGYKFVGWVDKNGAIIDPSFDPTNPNATFKMPAGNVEVQATFAPIRASITIKKTVVGNRGNANDVFLISMKEGSTLVSSLALKRGETSGALTIGMEGVTSRVITISEIIPMDYATGFTISIANQSGSTATFSGRTVTIHPGDDVTITVENTFAPTEYFKGKDFVKNIFK